MKSRYSEVLNDGYPYKREESGIVSEPGGSCAWGVVRIAHNKKYSQFGGMSDFLNITVLRWVDRSSEGPFFSCTKKDPR